MLYIRMLHMYEHSLYCVMLHSTWNTGSVCVSLYALQDGLFVLSQEPELIKGYDKVILTPNYVELQRLYKAVLKEEISNVEPIENVVSTLAHKLGNVTLVLKGEHDVISNGKDGEH